MLAILWKRLIAALTTIPSFEDWGLTVGIFAIYSAIAFTIGKVTDFLRWQKPINNWLRIWCQTLFAPALVEEMIFRVFILPHSNERITTESWLIWAGASLFLFLIYHPINALTLYKAGYPTFLNSTFLLLASLLGIACTLAYSLTGSIWSPVVVHWLVVAIWLCYLGGYQQLTESEVGDHHL